MQYSFFIFHMQDSFIHDWNIQSKGRNNFPFADHLINPPFAQPRIHHSYDGLCIPQGTVPTEHWRIEQAPTVIALLASAIGTAVLLLAKMVTTIAKNISQRGLQPMTFSLFFTC